MKNQITVEIESHLPVSALWTCFTEAHHIMNWNFAHESWHCPHAALDFKVGGTFSYRMEAKDGSFGFDLNGVFTQISHEQMFGFNLEDGRQVELIFTHHNGISKVTETFEPESENALDHQQLGWQMILNNFKQYAERQYAALEKS
jgi:uncharacterized protein YndB with AHSA1/START domain